MLPIERLIVAPAEFNVRVKEDNIVKEMLHYLVNIPDKTTKQTLCVMPVMKKNNRRQPESWDEVKDGQFYIINGQHSVAASKMMMEEGSGVSEEVQNHFKTWNCFIVWSLDAEKLRYISAFYYCVNHFQAIQLSWVTNILGVRSVWIAMGRPKHPKGDGTPQSLSRAQMTNLTSKFRVSNLDRADLNCKLLVFYLHLSLFVCPCLNKIKIILDSLSRFLRRPFVSDLP